MSSWNEIDLSTAVRSTLTNMTHSFATEPKGVLN